MSGTVIKQTYIVPCASSFRDRVSKLAARRQVSASDLARAVLLMAPEDALADFPDPGGPRDDDRETVIVKSGADKGRIWRREPRVPVNLIPGLEIPTIRRALAMALAMDRGELDVLLKKDAPAEPAPERENTNAAEVALLRTIVSALSFEPLPDGIRTRDEALHVLGFPPGRPPAQDALKERFRRLAAIHHPDSPYGNHRRMSQLNAAMDQLRGVFF